MSRKSWALCGLIATAVIAGVAAGPASADVTFKLADVSFDDGGTLSGTFTLNTYGQLAAVDLTSSPDGAFGMTYTLADSYSSTDGKTIDLYAPDTYANTLQLSFANPLGTGYDPLLLNGVSFECLGSYSCPTGGTVRYITGGFAAVPEPAAWAMMLVGVGGLGAALRSRRKVALAAV